MKTLASTLLLIALFPFVLSAQIYFQENFDQCSTPQIMTFEDHGDSNGWLIGDHTFHTSEKFPLADNGTCFAAVNDDKYDSEDGSQHVARQDAMITPWIDLSGAQAVSISYEYMTMQGSTFGLFYSHDEITWHSIALGPSQSFGGMVGWQPVDILLIGGLNPKIKDPSQPVKFKFQFDDRGLAKFYGAAVDNIVVQEAESEDVAIAVEWMTDYTTVGRAPVELGLQSFGVETVFNVGLAWTINGGPISRETVQPLMVFTGRESSGLSSTEAMINFDQPGTYEVTAFIETVNGRPSSNPQNDTLSWTIEVVPELPKRKVISYKFSHHTCTPCYAVNEKYKTLLPQYPDIIPVAVQNSTTDPMMIPDGRVLDALYCGFTHPGTIADLMLHTVNRRFRYTRTDFPNELALLKHKSPASIEFKSVKLLEASNSIEVVLESEFFAEVQGDLRMNLYVLEDSLRHYQAGAPQGSNYYHMNILLSMEGGINGVEGSVPTINLKGDVVSYPFTIPIQNQWKLKDIHFVGMIQNKTGEPLDHYVMNSESATLTEWLSSSSNDWTFMDVELFPNPTIDHVNISFGDIMDEVEYMIYDNTGKMMIRGTDYGPELKLEVSDWPAGVYTLQLRSGRQIGSASFIKS